VYYGATASEAQACEGDEVYVVGAANSAGQAALNFARHAKRVVMLVRSDSLELLRRSDREEAVFNVMDRPACGPAGSAPGPRRPATSRPVAARCGAGVSALVAAAKSYSQLDRAALQTIDVTEGLDSTLVMLGHKLGGVTVVREYASDVPRIEAIPGELNQVWTNVVENAIDAMEGSGTLTISTRAEPDRVVIQVADTGAGMPQHVQEHAFEPFFTTKDVGKGTGLGLDISRRIVEDRHHGEIAIESEPGATVVTVALPISR
jgi:signal transduction histidine kinase